MGSFFFFLFFIFLKLPKFSKMKRKSEKQHNLVKNKGAIITIQNKTKKDIEKESRKSHSRWGAHMQKH